MPIADIVQFVGLAGTMITGILGYGRLQERVEVHDEHLAGVATKESLAPFQDEVLRRLERIERKQDSMNGKA